MKKRAALMCLLMLSALVAHGGADILQVNGYLHEVDHQPVLHVWGTHYEMGYAQGYILGDEIMQMMREYVLSLIPESIYLLVHIFIPPLFEVPEEYLEEAHGIIYGIYNSGADTYMPTLGRHVDIRDLLLCNAVGDIGAMACSCQMAWGAATLDDPALGGETAVMRNLDWTLVGPNRFLLSESTIVIVYTPTIPGRQTVVSATFPGFFGCLTCMNEQGVAAVVNIAHNGIPLLNINFAERFNHSGFTLRQALHQGDPESVAQANIQDVIDHVAESTRSGALAINLAEPVGRSDQDPIVVLEADNEGWILRTAQDEPEFTDYVLASTNVLRKLRRPSNCARYDSIREQIMELEGKLTIEKMWEIEASVTQDWFLSTTAQTVYFIPETREMGIAFTSADALAPEKSPAILQWEQLTQLPEGVDLTDDNDAQGDDDDELPAGDSDDEDEACCG